MRDQPLILVVDDNEANVDILETRLATQGYTVITARDGEEALARTCAEMPDLILLDVMMPKLDGFEVTKRLKANKSLPFIPIILVTAKADSKDIISGFNCGADDYLTKPIDQAAMVARVRSMLRIKSLQDTAQEQAELLAAQSEELVQFNQDLQIRVASQVAELERFGQLRRFLPRQLAELVLISGDVKLLDSHRREISVVFCDLRGFTAFAEIAEPEELMVVLAEYHAIAGPLIEQYEGTLERFLGDGMMVLFNDPLPCPDAILRAVRLAAELQRSIGTLCTKWHAHGYPLGFGVGIAHGFATLGSVGFEGRSDYTAIGTVVNQASRLCGEAKAGEILITKRVATAISEIGEVELVGELSLKGLRQTVTCYRLVLLKT